MAKRTPRKRAPRQKPNKKLQQLQMQYGRLQAQIKREKGRFPKKYDRLIDFAERGARFTRAAWSFPNTEEKRLAAVIEELKDLCKILKKL